MTKTKHILLILAALCTALLAGCDDDTFSTSPDRLLTFDTDTVKLDTVFSTVPSSTQSFWIRNKSGNGLRCTSVRLERGNQTGFRVNVDGQYLGQSEGFSASDIEIRNKDSIRVFVEVTLPANNRNEPTKVTDNLVFTLESGKQQKVCLEAWAWDANIIRQCHVSNDSTIDGTGKPLVVYGGIDIAEGATLTIKAGTTIYFHSGAGINVHGRLVCEGTADAAVTLRSDRLDKMFDYLPYDRMSGLWDGIRFFEESYGNTIAHTDIHSPFDGVKADSSDVTREKLTITNSTIHNCQGYGLVSEASYITMENCQVTNTLNDCVYVNGGNVSINNCTLAQFYPFDARRGNAIHTSSIKNPLTGFDCRNSLITGYADDLMLIEYDESGDNANEYMFSNCIIRTPKVDEAHAARFKDVVFEGIEDDVSYGSQHFTLVDGDNQKYDFHLSEKSAAIEAADAATATTTDHDGRQRKPKPDIGAYEFIKPGDNRQE